MSNIKIISQYLKDLSFEIPHAPEIFLEAGQKPDIELAIDIDAKKLNDETYEVTLKIKAEAKVKAKTKGEDKKLFICESSYSGIFNINSKVEKEEVEKIILIFCPNLLFPFARKVIADAVINGGFPPLMLDPIDFSALYEKRKKAN